MPRSNNPDMQGVEEGARQLSAVDAVQLNNGTFDMDDLDTIAPKFVVTFTSLANVMEVHEMRDRARAARHAVTAAKQAASARSVSDPARAPGKRVPSSPVSANPAKRLRVPDKSKASSSDSRYETPERPAKSSDPDYTGGTIESKDEEYTKKLVHQLFVNTMASLGKDFRRIQWQRSGRNVELCQT